MAGAHSRRAPFLLSWLRYVLRNVSSAAACGAVHDVSSQRRYVLVSKPGEQGEVEGVALVRLERLHGASVARSQDDVPEVLRLAEMMLTVDGINLRFVDARPFE